MIILLPDAKDGLKDLENNLSKINLNNISNKMSQYHVTVKLPRFKLEQSVQLEKTLSNVRIHINKKKKSIFIYLYNILAWMSNNVYSSGKLF